jgi:hypothetical protein
MNRLEKVGIKHDEMFFTAIIRNGENQMEENQSGE